MFKDKKPIPVLGLMLFLSACLLSCDKPAANNFVIPAPTPGGSSSGTGGGTETVTLCTDIGETPIVLAYFTEYTEVMPDPTLLTHINYAHGRFRNPSTGDGGIVVTESKKAPISSVVALKSKNPKLKVMLMIGGWGKNADGFSEMAKSGAKRTEFCQSVKSILDKYKLDGVDIDWEYPTVSADNETGADKADTQNFNLVLQELRETLGTDRIISFASSSSGRYVDWKTAIKYIDYVNVMTYDMGAAPDGHNSPLHKSSRFTHRSWDESIEAHVSAGVPKDRQVMGIPFYGKAEKNPSEASKLFEYSVKYYEIAEILEKGTYKGKSLARAVKRQWEPTSMVPFLVDDTGKNVLSYDDPESVEAKGLYVKDKGLLGGPLSCGCPSCTERFAAEGVDLEAVRKEWEARGDDFLSVSAYTPENGFVFSNPVAADFFKAKGHVVSGAVSALADSLHTRGLLVGMDLYAPFMAPFVGQDYSILAEHADFLKPKLYRKTDAPAGMGFEYELLKKAAPGAAGYPEFEMDLPFLESQLEALSGSPCPVYPGIEVNYRTGIAATSPDYIMESLDAVRRHHLPGAVLSWNVMEAPDAHLACLRKYPEAR